MEVNSVYLMEQQQLNQFIKIVPTSAIVVDVSGNILLVNQELLDTLGYDLELLMGKNINQLLPNEYRSNHTSLMQGFFYDPEKRKMGGGKELFALKSNGDKIPIEIGLNPIEVEGNKLVLATLVDISARIQTNKMFLSAVNHAPYGVLVVNTTGIIHFANDSLFRCFGYKSEEVIGKPLEMLLPKRYRHNHQNLMNSYLLDPTAKMMGLGRDLTALHSDGIEFPVEIGLKPFFDENNNEMVLVSLVDITQRKRTEIELQEKNTNLEEFTYVASHDLRSPLRGIADLLEWVKEDLGPDCNKDVSKNLGRISVRIQRMEQLMENLLSYARSSNISSEITLINIEKLLENILSLIEVPSGFKVVTDISVDSFESTMIPLETVLRNLISNAYKHHNKDHGQIEISCHRENNMLHFTISDDGPGIPEAAKERIFKLFQTVTSSDRGSTGIGLSVCRRLTETHGGKIYVENNKQEGVTFHLFWPNYIRKDMHD